MKNKLIVKRAFQAYCTLLSCVVEFQPGETLRVIYHVQYNMLGSHTFWTTSANESTQHWFQLSDNQLQENCRREH